MLSTTANGSVVRILLVTSKFNHQITSSLHQGCRQQLLSSGRLTNDDLVSVWVPGAFEIPVVVAQCCEKYDCVICLGAIIKGETHHFELLAHGVTKALLSLSVNHKTPIIHEILATDNYQQALARCGIKGNNKGESAALTALAMIDTMRELD